MVCRPPLPPPPHTQPPPPTHPHPTPAAAGEEKFRRIRLSNPAVAARVGAYTGAVTFLELAGFKRVAGEGEGVGGGGAGGGGGEDALEMPAGGVDQALLQTAGQQLQAALTNPFFGAL